MPSNASICISCSVLLFVIPGSGDLWGQMLFRTASLVEPLQQARVGYCTLMLGACAYLFALEEIGERLWKVVQPDVGDMWPLPAVFLPLPITGSRQGASTSVNGPVFRRGLPCVRALGGASYDLLMVV